MCSLFSQEREPVASTHLARPTANPHLKAPFKAHESPLLIPLTVLWHPFGPVWLKIDVQSEKSWLCWSAWATLNQHLDSFSLVFPQAGSKCWQSRSKCATHPDVMTGAYRTHIQTREHTHTHTDAQMNPQAMFLWGTGRKIELNFLDKNK